MSIFNFKYFKVKQADSAMKVGTDALLLASMAEPDVLPGNALDVGTGTGVVALIIAQRFKDARVDAIDIDAPSVKECEENFIASAWSDRLSVFQIDFRDFQPERTYDLIISNPPYYGTTNRNEDKRKARARHVDSLPLVEFSQKCSDLLSETGEIWLIFPFEDQFKWKNAFEKNGLFPRKEIAVSGKEGESFKRLICAFTRTEIARVEEITFAIRDLEGKFSSQYKLLTAELHDRILP